MQVGAQRRGRHAPGSVAARGPRRPAGIGATAWLAVAGLTLAVGAVGGPGGPALLTAEDPSGTALVRAGDSRTSRLAQRTRLPDRVDTAILLSVTRTTVLTVADDGTLLAPSVPSWAGAVALHVVDPTGAPVTVQVCRPLPAGGPCTPPDRTAEDPARVTVTADDLARGAVRVAVADSGPDPQVFVEAYVTSGLDVLEAGAFLGDTMADLPTRTVPQGGTSTLDLGGVPAGAVAVSLHLTTAGSARPTDLWACSAAGTAACDERLLATSVPGEVRSQTVLVPLGAEPTITVRSPDADTRLSARVMGYVLTAAGAADLLEAERAAQAAARLAAQVAAQAAAQAAEDAAAAAAAAASAAADRESGTLAPTEQDVAAVAAAVASGGITVPATPPPDAPSRAGGTPGPSNTGVPAGTVLTRFDGNLVITTPNTVVSGLDIRGFVDVRAPGVIIRNSIIRGQATTGSRGLVTVSASQYSLTIEDSELAPTTPSPYIDGLRGMNITARRLNIHHVIDQAHIYGSNVTITASWLHDNAHFTNDPTWGGGPSHDDNIQIQSGSAITLTGNSLSGSHNAAIMLTQDGGPVSDVRITNNLLDGGACTVNIKTTTTAPARIALTDNTFGRNAQYRSCGIKVATTIPLDLQRNLYTDGITVTRTP